MTSTLPTVAVLVLVVTTAVVAGVGPVRSTGAPAAASPDIDVEPETLRFGTGPYEATERTLLVRNVGDAPLTVRTVVVVGPDRDAFDVGFEGPVRLAPGERRELAVSFEAAGRGPWFGTLHVLSDDPDEPQRNVWLTTTETVADVSPSRVLARKTLVNATVRDVRANTTQSLNVSWPLTRDDPVAVDALSFTPERDGDLALSLATNRSRFADVPAFALADGTEPAGFLRVDHTVDDEAVRNVTFTVRVRKDLLAGNETGPEDVALYRYGNGTWTELPTRRVGESDSHFFFEARAPGLSDFATGIKQATFRITDAVVTVTRISTAEGTDVLVRVRNVGGADGTYTVTLLLGDEVVDRRELSIAPNGTRQATFERSFDEPGTYEVFVNDRFVATVAVNPVAATTTTDPPDGTERDGTASGGTAPGFGPAAAVLGLLAAAALLVRRRA